MAFHKSWLREIMLKHGRPLKQRAGGGGGGGKCARGDEGLVMDVSLFTGITWEGRGAWQRRPERRKGM